MLRSGQRANRAGCGRLARMTNRIYSTDSYARAMDATVVKVDADQIYLG